LADIGLTAKTIHGAREVRDAEETDPSSAFVNGRPT
jgi:hypothetical protein